MEDVLKALPVASGTAHLWPLSVAEYLGETGLLPKNTELLYGVVYKKMSISLESLFTK